MNDVLELKARRIIFQWVNKNPGCHQREIQRGAEMPTGQLTYHLDVMIKNEILVSSKDGNFTRYYPRDTFNSEEKIILGFLRRELPRGILLYILINPNASQQNIARNFMVSEPTISYHLSKMVESNIMHKQRVAKEVHFQVNNPIKVTSIIIAYKQSFLDSLVDTFARIWVRM